MKRREFMAAVGAAAAAQGLAGRQTAAGESGGTHRPERPNILFILADQHRADCLGCYGSPDVRTPHLDALAADGVRYDQCYCPYPVCTPSRYSMLSGLYVHEHRGCSNRCTLPPGIDTFPAILRDAGYQTAAVGKMHFTPTYLNVGFERLILSEQDGDGRWDDDYHRELMANDLIDVNDIEDQRREYREHAPPAYWESFGALPSNLPRKYHSTDWTGRKASEIVEEWGPEGNMLMVSFIKPHHPFDPPAELCDLYDPEKLTVLPGWTDECLDRDQARSKGYFPNADLTIPALRKVMAYYYACIEQIDMQVGLLVEQLKAQGLYDNTVIVYAADHGEYLGFHHMLLKGNHMYDPVTRVPFIIKYPKAAGLQGDFTDQVSLVDLAPTLLGQTHCMAGPRMHGIDLGEAKSGRHIVFTESNCGRFQMARTNKHKLLASIDGSEMFFFDLERDPDEVTSRHDDPAYADAIEELQAALKAWRPSGEVTEPFLDPDAAIIRGDNVLSSSGNHRDAVSAYYARKMAEVRRG